MKTFLMHKDQDFDLQRKLPPNEQALTQDLELNTLFNAMALGDTFVFAVAKSAVLSGLAMVTLARRSSNLTIPAILPKDEASITHAQSAVTTSEAIASITGFSCRAAPSQNTIFPARSPPLCLG